ncbi:hypothetical protein E1B28_008956 [Marasmius oreades]|uniref:Uncharacterized protein n=1 Tax=Marasmius oreades TaxID=181124 RepID=A0A9P7USM8_9AGAR|nr:uncharacterized protein E1B28_008956 [Marasmius oreades]KAG7092613.1 hypothetical protein E1B28_008956 [Marasmius oreades]
MSIIHNSQEPELIIKRWSSHPVLNKEYSGGPGECVTDWLRHIERCCRRFNVASEQWIQVALHFMRGEAFSIVKPALEECEEKGEVVDWDDFKETLKLLEAQNRVQSSDPQATSNSSLNNKLTTKIIGQGLVAGGSSVVLPTVGIATLNAVGFTSSGVAAGSLAAGIQSVIYGGATGGVFSALQSIGATAVMAPPVAIALGVGAITAGCVMAVRGRRNDENATPEAQQRD